MKVEGLRELETALMELAKEYGPKAGAQAMRPAVRAAAKPVTDFIEATTPRDSGRLAETTKLRIGKPSKKMLKSEHFNEKMVLAARMGWTWKGSPSFWSQALALEFGTTEMSATATLRNAFDQHVNSMINDFGSTLGPAIEKKAKALNKKR